jgi:RNA polymerase sigma-70 factor (ECF subfamily)
MTDDRHARFMALFLESQHDIRAFVAAGIHAWDQVDDLMQELASVLWRKFDSYDATYAFGAWSRGIARNLLLRRYAQARRDQRLLSEEALAAVEAAFSAVEEDADLDLDAERKALHFCLDALGERARELLHLRYDGDLGLEAIAESTGSSYAAVKKALTRTRKQLVDCCERHLTRQEAAL